MAEKTIKLRPLNNKQRGIVEEWLKPSTEFLTVSCGRQVGKTETACVIAIITALNPLSGFKSCQFGIFLPTYKQCKVLFNRIKSLVGNQIQGLQVNKTEMTFAFPNGSMIRLHTAINDSMRGFTYDYIAIDEACMVDGEIWEAGIEPTISVAQSLGHGKVILTSTPKEKNWFYNFFMSKEEGHVSITFTSYDSPLHKKHILDRKRLRMNEALFRNEYLAEFQDGSAGMFDLNRATLTEQSKVTDTKAVVAGLDWGGKNDFTVLTLMNKQKQLIAIYRWVHIEYVDMYHQIVEALNSHNKPVCWSEKNGVGEHATAALKRLYKGGLVKPWTTSAKSKAEILMKLSDDILTDKAVDRTKLLNDEDLVKEFENYAYKFVGGQFRFVGLRPDIHDDIVMSLAICNYNFKIYKSVVV